MFLNDLYTIVRLWSTPEKITSLVKFDAGHALFQGHFPGTPVTPGAVQLQMMKEILENCLRREIRMTSLRTCKFLEILDPNRFPEVEFSFRLTLGEAIQVNASAASGDVTFFKAQVTFM